MSSEEMRERKVLRMEKLSEWHLTSKAMIEICLSPFPKEMLRICRSNAEKNDFFPCIIFIVIDFAYTFAGFIIFGASNFFVIGIGERCDYRCSEVCCFDKFTTLSLADEWRVMEVLVHLNQPIHVSRWVEYLLN